MTTISNDVSFGRQVLRREVNIRIRNATGENVSGTIDVFCECGRRRCADRIRIAVEEYEEVLVSPARCVVSAGHEDAAAERLVGREDGYVVVERDR